MLAHVASASPSPRLRPYSSFISASGRTGCGEANISAPARSASS